MKADNRFITNNDIFWSNVKIFSQKLGYSIRNKNKVKSYTVSEIIEKAATINVSIPLKIAEEVSEYSIYRANVLNNDVFNNLMNQEDAKTLFYEHYQEYIENNYESKIPKNKQSNEKKDYNYFTGLINIIAEREIKKFVEKHNLDLDLFFSFNSDPKSLTYITNSDDMVKSSYSRHFDGAYPGIKNPLMLWEIKEYYYTKTFGSRVADGIYETLLDGYEIKSKSEQTGYKVEHLFMVDGKFAWWNLGKSYLCRIVDMLNQGYVDEALFGKEVITEWPIILEKILIRQHQRLYGIRNLHA